MLAALSFNEYENHDIAIAMSSSLADPVLGWIEYSTGLTGGI